MRYNWPTPQYEVTLEGSCVCVVIKLCDGTNEKWAGFATQAQAKKWAQTKIARLAKERLETLWNSRHQPPPAPHG
jgi:hypothetical protein